MQDNYVGKWLALNEYNQVPSRYNSEIAFIKINDVNAVYYNREGYIVGIAINSNRHIFEICYIDYIDQKAKTTHFKTHSLDFFKTCSLSELMVKLDLENCLFDEPQVM